VVVTTLDALTYAGHRSTLAWLLDPAAPDHDPSAAARHRFVHGDIRDAALVRDLLAGVLADHPDHPDHPDHADHPRRGRTTTTAPALPYGITSDTRSERRGATAGWPPIDAVCHLAAESHVDRSITGPAAFLETNVNGTGVVLDACRDAGEGIARVLHVSTDEVYGPVPAGERRTEGAPFSPSSPYAASKAAGDHLAHAYHVTYGTPVVTIRPANTYGSHQLPEKLIPRFATTLLDGGRVPVYGDGQQVRDWTHVTDTVRAMHLALTRGTPGTAYNAGAGQERTNLELTRALLALLDLDDDRIEHVTDRLGHDRRYAVDSSRIAALGWAPQVPFDRGLAETLAWYAEHRAWWRRLVDRDAIRP